MPRGMRSAWPRLAQRLDRPDQRALLAALTDYGHARGWTPATLQRARRSLTVLLISHPAFTHKPMTGEPPLGKPPPAAEVRAFLVQRHLIALRVTEFLTDQELVARAPDAVLDAWLTRRLAPLPDGIRAEVTTWIQGLRGRGPRAGRPRKPATIQGYLRALTPALTDWASRYGSLRQVTTADITTQLAQRTGATRLLTLSVMRSLFGALTSRRLLFTDPTAGQLGRHATPPPALELDPHLRAGLLARLDQPGERMIVLLAGVHALRPAQLCALTLDAVDLPHDRLLGVDGQPRRLDALTRQQLLAWLAQRAQRWPATANPHLLINHATAGGLQPVSRSFVQAVFQRLGLTAQDLRVDRFMTEVHATSGDPFTLTQLFGISDPTAIRYCAELGPPDHTTTTGQFTELTAPTTPKARQ
jgi:hypothetical protein